VSAPVRVFMRHIRGVRFCSRGARLFFKRHGLDWQRFLKTGIPAEALEATGDAMAITVARHAREEHARGR
jgi:hypothetical protein